MNFTAKPSRRRGLLAALLACAAIAAAIAAPPAEAGFGLHDFNLEITNADGSPATQAGSHPFAVNTTVAVNSTPPEEFFEPPTPEGSLKDLITGQMPGLVGDATTMPQCSNADFVTPFEGTQPTDGITSCSDETAVGIVSVWTEFFKVNVPVFNLVPPAGVPARIGFRVLLIPITIDVGAKGSPPYNLETSTPNTTQIATFLAAKLQLWGNPADPAHDSVRGLCGINFALFFEQEGFLPFEHGFFGTSCPSKVPDKPFLTLPTSCQGPAGTTTSWKADSWENPGRFLENGEPDLSDPDWVSGSTENQDNAEPPNPQGLTGCGRLGFAPKIESRATTDQAESGSGLDFNVGFDDEGLKNPEGLAESQLKKAEVTLPEGVTINPSVGEGLGVCTPADIARETLHSTPGQGCPDSSKVGTVRVDTPLVDESVDGSVYLAQEDDPTTTEPGAENPFDSLIALYMVLRNTNLGLIVKEPIKVEPDPRTGRLVATLDDNVQFPFNHFNFHFKEGVRAALVTPSTCGTYTTEAKFWPWSDPAAPRTVFSSFQITKGKGGGPCAQGGIPPFNPHFEAGALNNNAGSFSPFDMRITREDGEQDMTKFSAILPPGELGSLAGVSKCPDSAIAIARSKTGKQELASPSCPANSLIGHTLAGAGVGSALTYVKGQVYLGGPYHGDPLSVIAITPAIAGPFDAGTVVVQEALTLNPKTAEVEVDGAASDPIPHIIKGIVLKLRDLRVYVDRPNFTLNPTSCDESKARSVLFGSYLNVLDPSDDRPVDLSTRYQAANCLNLGFKPDLRLSLKGGTKRGGHPGLTAIYTPRAGDANIKGLSVRLPRSAFLDQAHIKTICTRVQFAAGGGNGEQCPAASKYGFIKAWTPLLDEPLEGPVFLRSSNHKLPDLLFALHGLVDIEVDVRIDSQKGGIRATLEEAPDAPLSKVVLHMQGAKKGLIINSKDLCGSTDKASILATGHNGKESASQPVMKAQCGGKRAARHHRRHRG